MTGWQIYNIAMLVVYLGVLAFAAVVGRNAERNVSLCVFAAAILTWIVPLAVQNDPATANLVVDAALAIALLGSVLRYRLLWIGAAACSQCLLLAFSSTRLLDFPLTKVEYLFVLNLSSVGVFASLFVGTLLSRRKQVEDELLVLAGATPTLVKLS